jgi:hypothetical protein
MRLLLLILPAWLLLDVLLVAAWMAARRAYSALWRRRLTRMGIRPARSRLGPLGH